MLSWFSADRLTKLIWVVVPTGLKCLTVRCVGNMLCICKAIDFSTSSSLNWHIFLLHLLWRVQLWPAEYTLVHFIISTIYSLIINLQDAWMCFPTPVQYFKLMIYFYKQEGENANTWREVALDAFHWGRVQACLQAGGWLCCMTVLLSQTATGGKTSDMISCGWISSSSNLHFEWSIKLAIFKIETPINTRLLFRDTNAFIRCFHMSSRRRSPGLQMHLFHWNNHLWMQHSINIEYLKVWNVKIWIIYFWHFDNCRWFHPLPTSSSLGWTPGRFPVVDVLPMCACRARKVQYIRFHVITMK